MPRARSELSQCALAERAGTSQSAVARLEPGGVQPSVDTLQRLLAAAGFTLRFELSPAPVFGRETRVLGLDWLIHVKRAAGRPKDLEVIAELEALREKTKRSRVEEG